MKANAEIGMMHLQAKEHLEPLDAGEGEEGFLSQSLQREHLLHGRTFTEALASRTMREQMSVL